MMNSKSASSIFKCLGDPTRFRFVRLLVLNQTETCVCELVDALQEKQYNLFKHVKILEQAGRLSSHKDGRWIFYGFIQSGEKHLEGLYDCVATVADAPERFETRMRQREDGRCRIGCVN